VNIERKCILLYCFIIDPNKYYASKIKNTRIGTNTITHFG
jgi:hypothetical protein